MNKKAFLNLFKNLEFKNAPSLLKCYFTLGEKIEHICSEYDMNSVFKIIKKNQHEIASFFTATSETWTGAQIYEMLLCYDGFSKNSKEKACEIVSKFKIKNQKAKVNLIQKNGNYIILDLDRTILDVNDFLHLCANIYAINTFATYEKMNLLTSDFNENKYKELCNDYLDKIVKSLENIHVINQKIILKIDGTKKAPLKIRWKRLCKMA